ncbi:MAG TPA: CinA family protein [Candidatus Binataceae bacterium]|jgi:PncC family amidohydrolase|nr:CinA family protein [Candidatus Binataceae bacterium]
MQSLLPLAEKLGEMLKERGETVVVAESSTGGLVSAALLSVPGASAYFLGGAVVYTLKARRLTLDVPDAAVKGIRSVTEELALILARAALKRFEASWGLAEVGAAGPAGNRYGDPAGHSCIAVVGPGIERTSTVETGSSERVANMRAFSAALLELFGQGLAAVPKPRA